MIILRNVHCWPKFLVSYKKMHVLDLQKSKKISADFPAFVGNMRISVNCCARFFRSDLPLDSVCQDYVQVIRYQRYLKKHMM